MTPTQISQAFEGSQLSPVQLGRLNPYVAIEVVNCPPRRTFYPVAPKPLRIVTKACVNFPKYVWAKNAEEKFHITPLGLVFPIWRMENEDATGTGCNYMLSGSL